MMPEAGRIAVTLGIKGGKSGGLSFGELNRRVRGGLPYRSYTVVVEGFGIDRSQASRILHIPARTLARRKARGRFGEEESDRLARLARVLALAEEVLGDRAKATKWLQRRNRALAGDAPIDLMDTDLGTEQVEDVLTRIEYGVYD
jgi:putative toxin-antitoxin system antitoxin component (TIGR02293 family)